MQSEPHEAQPGSEHKRVTTREDTYQQVMAQQVMNKQFLFVLFVVFVCLFPCLFFPLFLFL